MTELINTEPPTDVSSSSTTPTEWSGRLIELLSRLESLRMQFTGRRLVADVEMLIGCAERMVQAADDLASRTTFPEGLAQTHSFALARAGAFYSVANGLKKPVPKGLFSSVLSALSGAESVSPDAVRDCLLNSVEVLNGYFMLFTEWFKSSTAARGWVDAATAFLLDYKQQIRDLPAT